MRKAVIASAIAPLAVPAIGWKLVNLGIPLLPSGLGDGAYVIGAVCLFLFVLPSFLLLCLWRNAPPMLYPIVGGIVPLPYTFFFATFMGALATEEELEARMQTIWFIPMLGIIAGLFVFLMARKDRKLTNALLDPATTRRSA